MILQHKPAFVMISVDHPNKKVMKLSRVITQAFPCCLIAFAEKNAPASYRSLSEAATQYLIYPPVTGPAVERTVNKYHKDQATPGLNSVGEKNYSSNYQAPEGVVNIKGKGLTLQNLMAQVMGEEASGNGYMPDGQTPISGVMSSEQDPQNKMNPGMSVPDEMPNPSYSSKQDPSRPKGSNGYFPDNERRKPGENFHRHTQKPNVDPEFERKRFGITDKNTVPTRNFQDSIILKGSREALEQSTVRGNDLDAIQKLEIDNEVNCILIDSPKFSGYLLTAMARNTPMKDDFIKLVHERLFKFLIANGEEISDQKNMNLQLKQVPFEDWAIEQAEFLCKSHHNKKEVAMAFFPHKDVFTKVTESASEEMCSVEVSSLEADVPVKCNIYIYLANNQKYILYTPEGSKIYTKQLEKLSREGISHVHILKHEVDEFNAYRAQNYLNNKIGQFEREAALQS